jgi:hypothetical protein
MAPCAQYAADAHFDAIDALKRWRLESARSETDVS